MQDDTKKGHSWYLCVIRLPMRSSVTARADQPYERKREKEKKKKTERKAVRERKRERQKRPKVECPKKGRVIWTGEETYATVGIRGARVNYQSSERVLLWVLLPSACNSLPSLFSLIFATLQLSLNPELPLANGIRRFIQKYWRCSSPFASLPICRLSRHGF